MSRARTTGPVIFAPTHSRPTGEVCFVATEAAAHTITLPEGHFSAVVETHVFGASRLSVISIMDHDEVENHIRLLRNAMEDAKRLDAGLPTRNAPGSPNIDQPEAIWVQWSDDGRAIRRWSTTPFDDGTEFRRPSPQAQE